MVGRKAITTMEIGKEAQLQAAVGRILKELQTESFLGPAHSWINIYLKWISQIKYILN